MAKRENRSISAFARTMLLNYDLPKFLWVEAMASAAYVLNLIPSRDKKNLLCSNCSRNKNHNLLTFDPLVPFAGLKFPISSAKNGIQKPGSLSQSMQFYTTVATYSLCRYSLKYSSGIDVLVPLMISLVYEMRWVSPHFSLGFAYWWDHLDSGDFFFGWQSICNFPIQPIVFVPIGLSRRDYYGLSFINKLNHKVLNCIFM